MSPRLKSLTIRGFKSIRELEDFSPRDLTILIGPNGAGKSNFVSFFRFMSWMLTPPGNLQTHVAKLGGASSILHDGVAVTSACECHLQLESKQGRFEYRFRLVHGAGDTFAFATEAYSYPGSSSWHDLGGGHRESRLITEAEAGDDTAAFILGVVKRCVVYQFHNTSDTARMRLKQNKEDNLALKEDGANIAPFLLRIRTEQPRYYARIVENIRLVLPFFADFVLEPEYGKLLLRWTEKGSDVVFGPDQASDGMLRVVQLWTLLLMPPEWLPAVLILDEPELGLHPNAIVHLAGMLRSASRSCQVIAATQSPRLVDEFTPDDVVVVERPDRASVFHQKSEAELRDWLEEYSLGQLWEKNILGGKPR